MEVERKFVVDKSSYENFLKNNKPIETLDITQIYIKALNGTFRLRKVLNDDNSFKFFVTLKKFVSKGMNEEVEINIDPVVAYQIAEAVTDQKRLSKIRRKFNIDGLIWEVDSFRPPLELTLAEVELEDINKDINLPEFISMEVTGEYKFSNEQLAKDIIQ